MKFRYCLIVLLLLVNGSIRGQAIDAYFVVEVSDSELVVGEPFIYSWTLYYTGDLSLDSANFIEPVFWGFSQRNLEDPTGRVEFIGGELYSVISEDIRLVPLRSGDYVIPSYRVEFPASVFMEDSFEIVSESIEISVEPLPQAPLGNDFSGLVGDVDIKLFIEGEEVNQIGDFIDVQMVISGNANLDGISAPELMVDSSYFRVNLIDTGLNWDLGLSGSRWFQWRIYPLVSGDFTLNFLPILYFDTELMEYREIEFNEVVGIVLPDGLMTMGNYSLSLKSMSHQTSYVKLPDFFWLLWIIPVLIPIIGLFLKRATQVKSKSQPEVIRQSEFIQSVSLDIPLSEQYLVILEQFRHYFYSKTETNSDNDLRDYLQSRHNSKLVTVIFSLIHEAESARFAPITATDITRFRKDVERIIRYFESQVK